MFRPNFMFLLFSPNPAHNPQPCLVFRWPVFDAYLLSALRVACAGNVVRGRAGPPFMELMLSVGQQTGQQVERADNVKDEVVNGERVQGQEFSRNRKTLEPRREHGPERSCRGRRGQTGEPGHWGVEAGLEKTAGPEEPRWLLPGPWMTGRRRRWIWSWQLHCLL